MISSTGHVQCTCEVYKGENHLHSFIVEIRMKNNNLNKKLEKGFDLFNLIYECSPDSWIWCKFNSSIIKKGYLNKLKIQNQASIAKSISKKLNCGQGTVEKHLVKLKYVKSEHSIPLSIIKELGDYINPSLKEKVCKSITGLYIPNYKSNPVKAIHYPSIGLAELVGAFAADGYFCKSNTDYYVKISEGRKDTLLLLSDRIRKIFNFNSRITYSKRDNTWNLWIKNKIISSYFENIFGFKPEKKSETVCMPVLIKKSEFSIRKAFVRGVFTFDGCVKTTGSIALTTRSKSLMEDIEAVLTKDKIQYNLNFNRGKDAWSLESNAGRNRNLLIKWKDYFFENSLKYKRILFFLGDIKVRNIEELSSLFPSYYSSTLRLRDLVNTLKEIKKGEANDLMQHLKLKGFSISKTPVYKYLFLLSHSGFITKRNYKARAAKNGFYRTIYSINSNI
jgi:hypothetical protein